MDTPAEVSSKVQVPRLQLNAGEARLASFVLKSPYFSRVAAQSSDTPEGGTAASGKTDNR